VGGDLFTVETTTKTARVELVLKNSPWTEYTAASFIHNHTNLFIALDRYGQLKIRDIETKVSIAI
jgi:hypothetical protein